MEFFVNNSKKVFPDSYYDDDVFKIIVATRCVNGIKTLFDATRCVNGIKTLFNSLDFTRMVQLYSELFDLFYTDESTDEDTIAKLKKMQFSFTSLLPDGIIYTLTDYLKGNPVFGKIVSRKKTKRINEYLDYSIKYKNAIPKKKLAELKISYMNYIVKSPEPQLTFFDYLRIGEGGIEMLSFDEFFEIVEIM